MTVASKADIVTKPMNRNATTTAPNAESNINTRELVEGS
jgi:hypothetical protein